MPREQQATLALNRGVLSQLALARVDLARYKMAASQMTNWMARVLGSMMLRPGTQYIGATAGNAYAKTIPFVFSATDTARIEITQGNIQVWVQDVLVTRVAVSSVVTNGSFSADLSGWTDSSEAGCTVAWTAPQSVSFVGTGNNNAILDQDVTVSGGSINVRHALRIVVARGPLTFRCGSAQGDDAYINETTLNTGTHSLAFTPTAGSFWIRFENSNANASLLASCNIEGAGVMGLPAPWASSDLTYLRWAQSADVTFVGRNGYQQQQIERRATDSWSIVTYPANDGPFRPINITNITLTPSAISGDITLTSNKAFFRQMHVGAIFRLVSVGQLVSQTLAANDTYTNPIVVNGIQDERQFNVVITGTFVGTLTLQRSVGAPGQWIDTPKTWTGPDTYNDTDGLDNQTIYYRVGFKPADYTSGTATVTISYASGSITGICRVTAFTDSTHVSAAVLVALGNTTPTTLWYEGSWSTFRGFPGTPQLWQGRLWWFGSSLFGSVSDDYDNFDDTVIGGSAPIIGQLDSGPISNIYWAVGLQQLILGTASNETSIRSSYLGEPVTTTNFNVMTGSTQGSSNVNALQIDKSGIFVQITGSRVFSLDLDISTYSYQSNELTLLTPDFNSAGIVHIAIQNKPDRRLHCVRADGTVGVMVWDPTENVTCWLTVTSANGGFVEDVCVLPQAGVTEDQVYYTVRRIVNGVTVRYHEKWALESECTGLPVAKHVDAHVVYSGVATDAIGGLGHLIGQTVSVWGWNTANPYIDGNGNKPGLDLGTYVVDGTGTISGISLGGAGYLVTSAIIGLPYTAQWQSMKQAFAAAMGTPLNQSTRIGRVGLMLQNTHAMGIRVGNDFQHLDDLPMADLPTLSSGDGLDGTAPDVNAILNDYDQQMSAFSDIWSTDSRVCLQAASPRPATVLAFTVDMENTG